MTEKGEYTILRKFFSSFSDEEIEVIKKNLLAQEGETSKKEAYYDNNQSFDNLIEKLKYKRSFGADKSISSYPTLFS